jgi:hypothetical protein
MVGDRVKITVLGKLLPFKHYGATGLRVAV